MLLFYVHAVYQCVVGRVPIYRKELKYAHTHTSHSSLKSHAVTGTGGGVGRLSYAGLMFTLNFINSGGSK